MTTKRAAKSIRVRHGELDIRKLDKAPSLDGYEPEALDGGRVIVGHSESGAVHCIERPSEKTRMYRKRGADIAYLCLVAPEELSHAAHRHKTTALQAGFYEVVVKRQANEDDGWSPVAD